MKFGVSALAVVMGLVALAGIMAPAPASAGHGKRCNLECEIAKIFSWDHGKRRDHDLFWWLKWDRKH